jgi:hypothetical protein
MDKPMKELKRFLALLIILAVLTVSVIVAFRLAPETWAMVAGVIFGVVAALPMCAVVIMMIRQRPAPPPPQVMAPPPPPQVILLHSGGPMQYPYAGQPAPPQHMLPRPNPVYYQAPPPAPAPYAAQAEWEDLDAEEEAEYWAPPAAPRASYRILGQ